MPKTKTPTAKKPKSRGTSRGASKAKTLPPRDKVKPADTWDLSSLFKTDAEWEAAFKKFEAQIPQYEKYKGHLGDSAEMLAACLRFGQVLRVCDHFHRKGMLLGCLMQRQERQGCPGNVAC